LSCHYLYVKVYKWQPLLAITFTFSFCCDLYQFVFTVMFVYSSAVVKLADPFNMYASKQKVRVARYEHHKVDDYSSVHNLAHACVH